MNFSLFRKVWVSFLLLLPQLGIADAWTKPYRMVVVIPVVDWGGGLLAIEPAAIANPAGCKKPNQYHLPLFNCSRCRHKRV